MARADPGSDFDMESPIWWDPKLRRSIYEPRSFHRGALVVVGRLVTVATTREVVCAADLDEVDVRFPGTFDLPVCDLTVARRTYRLFFCTPHPRTLMFDASVSRRIASVLDAAQGRGRLAMGRMPSARWPSQLTMPLGRRRLATFRDVVRDGCVGPEVTPSLALPPPPTG